MALIIGFLIFSNFSIEEPSSNSMLVRLLLLLVFGTVRLGMTIAMGPVLWMYITEIVQPNITPWCYFVNWVMLGAISVIFPLLCEWNEGNPRFGFLIFGLVALISLVGNHFIVIETKDKS